MTAPSNQSTKSASTLLPSLLLQGRQVMVMTLPPSRAGGTCSSDVAGSPQIGQRSKTRRRIGAIGVTSADSPGSSGRSTTSSVRPSGRAIDIDSGAREVTGAGYARAAASPTR